MSIVLSAVILLVVIGVGFFVYTINSGGVDPDRQAQENYRNRVIDRYKYQ